MVTRDAIIAFLTDRFERCAAVRAAWLGGSDATGRADAYSDIDYCVIADDDGIESVFSAADEALAALSPIQLRLRVPPTLWPQLEQVFYRLRDAGPHLLVDLCAIRASSTPQQRFMERERHGQPRVLLDPEDLLAPVPIDRAAHGDRMAAKLAELRVRFPLLQTMVWRSIERGLAADAVHFYMGCTLRPLIDLLRIAHCPERFDFGPRYTTFDLPPDAARAVADLSMVPDLESLRARLRAAAALFDETLAKITDSARAEPQPAPAHTHY